MRAVVYRRVSTREQNDSGLGLAAQRERCMAELRARGWELTRDIEEQASLGKRRSKQFEDALRFLDLGHADVLVVSRLDRLSRSVAEFAGLMARADEKGWKLLVLDPPVDMTTPHGRMMGHVAAAFAQLERELGSIRTREGLAALKARGWTKDGKPYVPAKRFDDRATIRRIMRLVDEQGMTYADTARWLNDHDVPTLMGKRWHHPMVGRIVKRERTKT